jgi:hypothetical protein
VQNAVLDGEIEDATILAIILATGLVDVVVVWLLLAN